MFPNSSLSHVAQLIASQSPARDDTHMCTFSLSLVYSYEDAEVFDVMFTALLLMRLDQTHHIH